MKDYLNLIRQIAWSFHKTTGIEWDELFGEASLAYCEALRSYQPKKSKESTWIFNCIENRLINFCKMEWKHKNPVGVEKWVETTVPTPDYEFFVDRFSEFNLSVDVKWIIRMVLRNPQRYNQIAFKTIGVITTDLRDKKKWQYERIWAGMRNLRVELSEIS